MLPRTLLSPEHEAFRDSFRRFAEREIPPFHAQWEDQGNVDREVWLKAGLNGFLCMTTPEACGGAGAKRTSLLLVERGMPGFQTGQRLKKLGLKAQDTAERFFEDVRVPLANLLGPENRGFVSLMEKLPWERLQIGQLFGGYGYMLEYPTARAFVDARVQRIYGRTNEIMKEVFARTLGLGAR